MANKNPWDTDASTDDWGLSGNASSGKGKGGQADPWGISSGADTTSNGGDWGLSGGSQGNAGTDDDFLFGAAPMVQKPRRSPAALIPLGCIALAVVLAVVLIFAGLFKTDASPVESPRVPIRSTPTPVRVTPTPVRSTPTPVRVTPTPVRSTPTPVRVTPTPTPTPTPTATPVVRSTTPSSPLFQLYPVSTRYYYHLLTENEKRLFSELYDGVAQCVPMITLQGDYTLDEYERVRSVLLFDCPEFIHNGGEDGYSSRYWYNDDMLTKVEITYAMTREQFDQTLTRVMDKIRLMAYQPDFGSRDYDKQMAIYRYLIQHNDYDKVRAYCGEANSAWLLGYAKCSGYTNALNLALRYYGIPCCSVWGYTYENGVRADESHEWTCVKLSGQWYHCDATWDDPTMEDGTYNDPFAHQVAVLPYMNLPDSIMMRERTLHPEMVFAPPACSSMAMNYYHQAGIIVPAGCHPETVIHQAMTKAYQRGENFFALAFESAADYRAVMAALKDCLRSWRYDGRDYGGCSYQYWDKNNLLMVTELIFRQ